MQNSHTKYKDTSLLLVYSVCVSLNLSWLWQSIDNENKDTLLLRVYSVSVSSDLLKVLQNIHTEGLMSHEEPGATDHSSVEWDVLFDRILSVFRTES